MGYTSKYLCNAIHYRSNFISSWYKYYYIISPKYDLFSPNEGIKSLLMSTCENVTFPLKEVEIHILPLKIN